MLCEPKILIMNLFRPMRLRVMATYFGLICRGWIGFSSITTFPRYLNAFGSGGGCKGLLVVVVRESNDKCFDV